MINFFLIVKIILHKAGHHRQQDGTLYASFRGTITSNMEMTVYKSIRIYLGFNLKNTDNTLGRAPGRIMIQEEVNVGQNQQNLTNEPMLQ